MVKLQLFKEVSGPDVEEVRHVIIPDAQPVVLFGAVFGIEAGCFLGCIKGLVDVHLGVVQLYAHQVLQGQRKVDVGVHVQHQARVVFGISPTGLFQHLSGLFLLFQAAFEVVVAHVEDAAVVRPHDVGQRYHLLHLHG